VRNLAKFLIPFLLIPKLCFGYACEGFDGANDHIVFTKYSALYDATQFTVLFYSLQANATQDHVAFSTWDGTRGIFIFSDDVGFGTGRTDNWNYRVCGSNAICAATEGQSSGYTSNTFQNILMTFVAGNSTGLNFYINGVLDGQSPVSTSSVNDAGGSSSLDIWLGERQNGSQDRNGKMAYLFIWNRVLSSAEIAIAQIDPFSIVDGVLQINPLWGDSPEQDLSGNGHTGTITGATPCVDGPPVLLGSLVAA